MKGARCVSFGTKDSAEMWRHVRDHLALVAIYQGRGEKGNVLKPDQYSLAHRAAASFAH